MSRLIDFLRDERAIGMIGGGPHDPPPLELQGAGLAIFEAEDLQVIVCDNVTEYLFAQTPKEHWTPRDFPSPRPPFDTVWIETRKPSMVRSGKRLLAPDLPASWGALVVTYRPEEVKFDFAEGTLDAEASIIIEMIPLIRWERRVLWPGFVAVMALDEDGEPCHSKHLYIFPEEPDRTDLPDLTKTFGPLLYPFKLAFSLMNCRNVETARENPPERLSKAHQRRHGRPLTAFHTIRVSPRVRPVRGDTGVYRGPAEPLPLHIVRGHFKTYSPEAPLLGKHSGRFWWPAYTRGTSEAGEVDHEYAVEAAR